MTTIAHAVAAPLIAVTPEPIEPEEKANRR
jgi:hypothetical protein